MAGMAPEGSQFDAKHYDSKMQELLQSLRPDHIKMFVLDEADEMLSRGFKDQVELAKMLLNEGQMHLFEHWPEPGVDDDKKKSFFDQVRRLNSSYPGGLVSYIQNARKLLADSKAGKNPYDGFTPSVPSGEVLTFGDDNFVSLEAAGVKEARNAAFVLVAGGLGERLGYKGIKVCAELLIAYADI
jgi:UDP-N-acetylglucosamine pyrophosphorylase